MAVLLLAGGLVLTAPAQIGGTGWSKAAVTFKIQWPTNTAENTRYFATNMPLPTYHCLLYSNDGAFAVGNTTKPRTEQRFEPDYTNGEIQYQANLMAVSNENSYCVFQIHSGDAQSTQYGSTTFMLFWFTNDNGSVHDYSGTELAGNLGNKWFQLNVDHNLMTRSLLVWINSNLVWTQLDNGAGDFYFKDGVYEQSHNPTYQMDTYITNILMWVSPGTNPPAAPMGLAATNSGTQINLMWKSSVNATNYNLKRATASGGPYTNLASLTGTNFTDTNALVGTAYYYVASAVDQFGESSNSAQVSFKLPGPPMLKTAMLRNNGFVMSGSNGVPTTVCYVISATNLSLPPGAWPVTATNTFDGSGSFYYTNPVLPGSRQTFYRLKVQ